MPRVARGRGKIGQRTRGRIVAASVAPIAARRAVKPGRSRSPAARPEWAFFVTRCLRSWQQARASASDFLATWTPLRLPDPLPWLAARADHSRRNPSRLAGRTASQRTAQHPSPSIGSAAWSVPVEAAGSVEVLRERYPLVTALLVELAALPRRGRVASQTQQRG